MERDWWIRAGLVLQRPRDVFAALRREGDQDERQDPVVGIVLLAGIGAVLMMDGTRRLLDDFAIPAHVVPVWAFVGGVMYGAVGYFGVGALVHLGWRLAGSDERYRRARHVLAFAAVPLALSLIAWPVRLAAFGGDAFRTGGGDEGAGGTAFELIELAAVLWAAGLLVVGTAVVNRWGPPRALAASVPALAVPALAYALALR